MATGMAYVTAVGKYRKREPKHGKNISWFFTNTAGSFCRQP
jgi:hypothetical protein